MKKEVKKIKSKKIIKSKKVKKVDKDMNKSKKAQVSLEMIIIIGVLILGAVILATILIGFTNEKVDQAGEIDAATNSTIDGFIKDLTNPEDYEPISGVGSNCILTLSSNPPAGGTVSGAGTFSCGTSVTANATALSGYTFNNWTTPTGSLSTNPYTFNLNSNTSLTANFSSTAPSTYTLNLTKTIGGTVETYPSGINCLESQTNCSATFPDQQSVQLNATPVSGYVFQGWSGDCSGSKISCSVSMTEVKNVTATFSLPVAYNLNLIENPDSVNISLNGAGNYNPGDVANISITSTAEFSYVNWIDQNGNVVSTDPSFSYTMPSSNVNLTAHFIPNSDAFISKWDTTKISNGSSSANQITLPLDSASYYSNNYNFKVYWGDGTTSEVTSYSDPDKTHTYSAPGVYTVVITGFIEGFRFNNSGDKLKLTEISQWGNINLGNNNGYFYGCSNLKIKAYDVLDLNGTTNLENMFKDVTNFWDYYKSMNNWDVSNVTNMKGMFQNTRVAAISDWDVSNVTDMSYMFFNNVSINNTSYNPDNIISNWDVSNVTNMSYMFGKNYFSAFDTSEFNQPLNNWDVSNVTNMSGMFAANQMFNQPLNNWDVSNVINMSRMFSGARVFNQDISNWNVSNVTNMSGMFDGAYVFNQSLNNWNVSNVTNMSGMFSSTSLFNQPLNNWNVSNVTNMSGMFSSALAFNQPLNNWNVSNVTNMNSMFYDNTKFNQSLGDWDVSNVTDMSDMFGHFSVTPKLSTSNYDNTLIGWSSLNLKSNVNFNAGNSTYSSASISARNKLINDYGWTIIDGGLE
jgi:uncharacterized repeat protein (TIGR02543 family)